MIERLNVYRVLLLEDDDDYYKLFSRRLAGQPARYEIVRTETLAEALRALEDSEFDVVLSDLNVPDSGGIDTVVKLREQAGRSPIIALTGLDDTEVEDRILACGGQDYLHKGEVDGREIFRAITHAIQRQQSQNEIESLVTELSKSQDLLREQAAKLKRKNRRLRRLYRMAHEFVDNVSHDFRTPLTVIKDYVNLIREGLVGEVNGEQGAMLDKVAVRADDLNHMVDDLLDVSKLDSGMLCCWRRRTDLQGLLRRAQSMLLQRAEVKGVELVVDCPADLPEVFCDIDKADRVLTNLAVNGIKFTGSGGTVRMWAEADPVERQVVVGVTDNGPGIEREALDRIFERFEQVETNMQPTAKGVGLGLSIAQRLTRLNLGELDVQSQVGRGSTFTFTLPYADPVEVFRRWLGFRTDRVTPTQLIEITVPKDTPESSADDLDHFLNGLLRRDDLLFRTSHSRWLKVIVADRQDAVDWWARFDRELEKANRNRPSGPLPCCRRNTFWVWGTHDEPESKLSVFEAACAGNRAERSSLFEERELDEIRSECVAGTRAGS